LYPSYFLNCGCNYTIHSSNAFLTTAVQHQH
jgi:hypothetical protein